MQSRYAISTLLVVCVFAVGAVAQETGTAPAADMPKLKPVMSMVPADAAGYVVVNNVKSCTDNIDKFLSDAGISQLIAMGMGGGPGGPGGQMPGVLQMLRGAAQLGAGFNPNGGFAAIMLNPEHYDLDIVGMIEAGMDSSSTRPAPKPQFKDIPLVLIVPGKGINEVFGAYEIIPGGKHTQVRLRMGTVLAEAKNGYIFLSPNERALAAVMSTGKSAASVLPKPEAELIAASDIAANVNIKTVRPLAIKVIELVGKKMKEQASGGPVPGAMAMGANPFAMHMKMADYYVSVYKQMFKQTDSITMAGRFVRTGLAIEGMATFAEGSALAKSAAMKGPGAAKLVNRIPNISYVLAYGASGGAIKNPIAEDSQEQVGMAVDAIASVMEGNLSDEDKEKMKKIFLGLNEQVNGVQFVGGGAPAGSGLFGVSMVTECKSADKFKALLSEGVELGNSLIQTADDEDLRQLQISYFKGTENVKQTSVDTIEFTHPEMTEVDDRQEMVQALGEDKVRLFVAKVDDNTVVMTFGGSKQFLGHAIKVAKSGKGTVLAGPDAATALKHMPKNTSLIMLFNGSNLIDVIKNVKNTMDPNSPPLPIQVNCKIPIAVGGGATGNTGHMVLYVPSRIIQELTGAFMGMMMPAPVPAPVPPPQGPQDF